LQAFPRNMECCYPGLGGAKLRGTLQLDMWYATIPVFKQQRRLYRETLMKYMVNSQEKLHNYPPTMVNRGEVQTNQ